MIDTHEIALTLDELIPTHQYTFDAHRRAVDILLRELIVIEFAFHAVEIHVELIVLVLQVDHVVFEERPCHVDPVGIGVSAGDVEVTVHATAFNVNLQGGRRIELLAGVSNRVDNVQMAVVVRHDHIQTGLQALARAGHAET